MGITNANKKEDIHLCGLRHRVPVSLVSIFFVLKAKKEELIHLSACICAIIRLIEAILWLHTRDFTYRIAAEAYFM